jgi:hypothetical protein
MTKATLKERNALFDILKNQINRGQNVLIRKGHTFERAAREFEAEGLVSISDANLINGLHFHVTREF